MTSIRTAAWLAFLLPATLLGGALISQYGFGLYPCEMCMWQRWPHLAAIILAAAGLAFRTKRMAIPLILAATMAILISGLIGGSYFLCDQSPGGWRPARFDHECPTGAL